MKKNNKSSMSFEFIGKVNIIERISGKKAKRTPIEGKLVLQCILDVLYRALDLQERALFISKK